MFRNSFRILTHTLSGLLLLMLTGFTAPHIHAQNFSYGLKAGINFANHYDAEYDSDPITTIRIGAFANVQLGNTPFSVQPEVFYFQSGAESGIRFDDIIINGTYRSDYIKVPLLLNYSLDLSRQLQAGFFTGPSVAFLLRSEFTNSSSGLDIADMTSNTDFGIVGGLKLNSPAISDRLSLEFRFSQGFTRLFEPGVFVEGSGVEGNGVFQRPNRNRAISVLLEFAF
jgi:hypothetical protein